MRLRSPFFVDRSTDLHHHVDGKQLTSNKYGNITFKHFTFVKMRLVVLVLVLLTLDMWCRLCLTDMRLCHCTRHGFPCAHVPVHLVVPFPRFERRLELSGMRQQLVPPAKASSGRLVTRFPFLFFCPQSAVFLRVGVGVLFFFLFFKKRKENKHRKGN